MYRYRVANKSCVNLSKFTRTVNFNYSRFHYLFIFLSFSDMFIIVN